MILDNESLGLRQAQDLGNLGVSEEKVDWGEDHASASRCPRQDGMLPVVSGQACQNITLDKAFGLQSSSNCIDAGIKLGEGHSRCAVNDGGFVRDSRSAAARDISQGIDGGLRARMMSQCVHACQPTGP
jgi:hypothetical protein